MQLFSLSGRPGKHMLFCSYPGAIKRDIQETTIMNSYRYDKGKHPQEAPRGSEENYTPYCFFENDELEAVEDSMVDREAGELCKNMATLSVCSEMPLTVMVMGQSVGDWIQNIEELVPIRAANLEMATWDGDKVVLDQPLSVVSGRPFTIDVCSEDSGYEAMVLQADVTMMPEVDPVLLGSWKKHSYRTAFYPVDIF